MYNNRQNCVLLFYISIVICNVSVIFVYLSVNVEYYAIIRYNHIIIVSENVMSKSVIKELERSYSGESIEKDPELQKVIAGLLMIEPKTVVAQGLGIDIRTLNAYLEKHPDVLENAHKKWGNFKNSLVQVLIKRVEDGKTSRVATKDIIAILERVNKHTWSQTYRHEITVKKSILDLIDEEDRKKVIEAEVKDVEVKSDEN